MLPETIRACTLRSVATNRSISVHERDSNPSRMVLPRKEELISELMDLSSGVVKSIFQANICCLDHLAAEFADYSCVSSLTYNFLHEQV